MKALKTFTAPSLIVICALLSSCERSVPVNGNNDDLPPGTWQFLGFDDKVANSFSISEPYLYVAALEDGVWRRNIKQSSADWEYLGLVSRDVRPGTYKGSVERVDAVGNDILAGLLPPIELEPERRIGVWRSFDGGKTWVPSDSGMRTPDRQWSGVFDVRRSHHDPQMVMAGYGAFYRSSDGGFLWQFVYPDRRDVSSNFLRFSWNPHNSQIVWALGQTNRGEPWLVRSIDGGLNWQFYHANRFHEQSAFTLKELAYDAFNSNIIYLATSTGVFKSTNGGQNWLDDQEKLTPILTDSTGLAFLGIVIHPRQPEVFFTIAAKRLYLSTDGGQSILIIPSPNKEPIISLAYHERSNVLYIGAFDGIFRLKDPLNAPKIRYK